MKTEFIRKAEFRDNLKGFILGKMCISPAPKACHQNAIFRMRFSRFENHSSGSVALATLSIECIEESWKDRRNMAFW